MNADNESPLRTKDMLLDIGSMLSRAKKYSELDKPYQELLQAIVQIPYFSDEDGNFPTIKELSRQTGIKYDKIRKGIRQIYDDLVLERHEAVPLTFSFKKTICCFVLSDRQNKRSITFETENLKVLPRVGEEITVPYFKAYLQTDWFHVESIHHHLGDNEQLIDIFLKPGSHNLFWQFRKDEAEIRREVSIHDLYRKSDWELQDQLGVTPRFRY